MSLAVGTLTAPLPHPCRYFFSQLARNGYRVANTELNLRCARTFSGNCKNYIEYSLVKTDDNGNVILGAQ